MTSATVHVSVFFLILACNLQVKKNISFVWYNYSIVALVSIGRRVALWHSTKSLRFILTQKSPGCWVIQRTARIAPLKKTQRQWKQIEPVLFKGREFSTLQSYNMHFLYLWVLGFTGEVLSPMCTFSPPFIFPAHIPSALLHIWMTNIHIRIIKYLWMKTQEGFP